VKLWGEENPEKYSLTRPTAHGFVAKKLGGQRLVSETKQANIGMGAMYFETASSWKKERKYCESFNGKVAGMSA